MAITWAAGQRITAAGLNAFVPMYYAQSADQTLNTATLTNHNLFASIPIGAGEIWVCELVCDVAGVAASDIKTSWSASSTVTTTRRHSTAMATTNTADPNVATVLSIQARATSSATSYGVVPENGAVRGTLQEKFVASGGVSGGTLTLQWACVAASGNVTMYAGSWFVAHRVS